MKRGLPYAALAVVLLLPAVAGARTVLVPGVTYERQLIFNGGRPVVLHIVRTPAPGKLYELRPLLARETVRGRRTVPAMQERLSARATTVGVNGDFFNLEGKYPSGIFMRGGVLSTGPNPGRSALALDLGGRLLVDVFRLVGRWEGESGVLRRLHDVNRPIPSRRPRVGLFTRYWGTTPRADRAVEVVLAGLPTARLDRPLTGTVVAVSRGGGTRVPPGGAVLQARGAKRKTLRAEAAVGSTMTVRLGVPALPEGTLDAIGGGPVLVRNGTPVRTAGEAFTVEQVAGRHPRTAMGQTANGGLLFVVADGRDSSSYGLTAAAMGRRMADLGAVTAMGLDGGGSSTLAFDGRVLNQPSDGSPRRVANGLFLHYYGIYAPAANGKVLSPNGDGVGDTKKLAAKVVRESDVRLRLLRPNGSVAWSRHEVVAPSWVGRALSNPALAEGRWRWVVEATDLETGLESRMTRVFRVNKTLGHLRLSRNRIRVRPRKGGKLVVSVSVTRPARLDVSVRRVGGAGKRVLFRGERPAGRHAWRWNGRTKSGRVARAGSYVVRVSARNELGTVSLRRSLRVQRTARR